MPSDLDTYGNDPDGPPPDPDNEVAGVHVPPVNFVLNNTLTIALQQNFDPLSDCLLYTSPSPRDLSTSRMPSSA